MIRGLGKRLMEAASWRGLGLGLRNRNSSRPRILVSWSADPQFIPPFKLSATQVTVGPKLAPGQPLEPYDAFTPHGAFDLRAALETRGLPLEYDAIVVASDSTGMNRPVNLQAFDCPKVLFVGDTHHLDSPIRKLIDYAKAGNFDRIVCTFTRQHAHWFAEAGFADVVWLPGLVPNVARPFSERRVRRICFFGHLSKHHVRRVQMLTAIDRLKEFPLLIRKRGGHHESADHYASSAVSLNCSLNGDLNLRVFEVLAAGGCLLTDRLSAQAGLDLLLKEGTHYVAYETVEECIEKTRFLLQNPAIALEIARSGHEAFHARMRPEQRARQLWDWMFHGRIDSCFRVTDFAHGGAGDPDLADRLRVYEALQELHRTHLNPSVLFMNDAPAVHILDALDLPHLRMNRVHDEGQSPLPSHEAIKRCQTIGRAEAENIRWDYVVAAT